MKLIVGELVVCTLKLLLSFTKSVHESVDCIVRRVISLIVKDGLDVVDEYPVVLVAVFCFDVLPEFLSILFIHKFRQGRTNTFGYGVVDDLNSSVSAYLPVFSFFCCQIGWLLFITLNNIPSIGDDEGVLTGC